MKILKYISLSFLLMAVVSGCESNLDKVGVASDPTAPKLIAISETVVVTEATLEENITIKWDRADFGFSDAANYSLYAYIDGQDPVLVTASYGSEAIIKYKDLNTAAIKLGVPVNELGSIKLYVQTSLSSQSDQLKSNEILLSINTYAFKDYIYFPGGHQGWGPGDPTAKRLSTMSPADPYTGFINFVDAAAAVPTAPIEFKITLQPGWGPSDLGGSFTGTPPNLEGTFSTAIGGNASIDPGFYYLTATIDSSGDPKTGAVTALLVNKLGIIGAAIGGWGDADDVVLIQDATNPYLWGVENQAFAADEFKIRINGPDWGNALGGSLEDAKFGGENIMVEVAGTYDFAIDFTDTPFTITMTKK